MYRTNMELPTWVRFPTGAAFMTTGLDRAYHAHRFIFSFTFVIFCLFRVVD